MSKLAIALAALATVSFVPAASAAESSQTVRAATADAAAAPVAVSAGKMIYGGNGQRIAPAYRVTADGTVQVILNGKLVNIPASTLSDAEGKVSTTLTKAELSRLR